VQNRSEINFPFKRYQIQPVWRADRPQKGRYREFYQCDVDVIGSESLLNEIELIQIIDKVFSRLGIKVLIKINNRKLLIGIAEVLDEIDKFSDITIAFDKLEKVGINGVINELKLTGIKETAIEKLQTILLIGGSLGQKLNTLNGILKKSEIGINGIEEIQLIFNYLELCNLKNPIELDITLARGLNYYTGPIIEVKSSEVQIGSICGGGRYDDLTGVFGLKDVSGVGVSFGADRIYDVLLQLDKFPEKDAAITKILFTNFGEAEVKYCFPIIDRLRDSGINTEIYPDASKLKKQLSFANNRRIKYVALIGEMEMKDNLITVKNMDTGNQMKLNIDDLIKYIIDN